MTPIAKGFLGAAAPAAVGAGLLLLLSACDTSFEFGQPSTRSLEEGAAASVGRQHSYEVTGTLVDAGGPATIDVQVDRAGNRHLEGRTAGYRLEAITAPSATYFRGREFLAQHLGNGPGSAALVGAAGDSWWRAGNVRTPGIPSFTDAAQLRAAFLGAAVSGRRDHLRIDGVEAVELWGPRASVYIAQEDPHQLLRVRTSGGAQVDGMTNVDLHYRNFDRIPPIVPPASVIDFADQSTLPPIYTVEAVDSSGCQSPCYVAALLRNLGGRKGARAQSTVAFSMADPASSRVLGTCRVPVQPDVDYNQTVTVGCDIRGLNPGEDYNAAVVTATPDNPGRA